MIRIFAPSLFFILLLSAGNVSAATPVKLAITSVSASPTDVTPFSVTVQAQDSNSASANVVANTTVALALTAGNGDLFGSLIAVIPAGQSSITFTLVKYDLAEAGVILTAFATMGDALSAGTSAPFTVLPGAATALAINVPNGTANGTAPFAVNVRAIDAQQNTAPVAADTAVTITLAAGSGVLGGTLSGVILAGQTSIALPITYSKPEANVRLRVARTSGDALTSATTFFNVADNAIKLFAFAPLNATAGVPFNVQVNAVDANGNSAPVTSSTTVVLTKALGFGALTGNLTGVISAGTSSVTFTNLSYDSVDSVKLTASATDGDALTAFTTSAFPVGATATPPVKLLASTFGPITAGAPFTVRVISADGSGNTKAVRSNTAVTVVLKTGTGTISGVIGGTIPAGSFLIDLTAVAYSKPESGVVFTATASGGDALSSADTTPFTVLGAPTAVTADIFGLPSANSPFDVSITAVDGSGLPTRVLADTAVSINAAPAAGTGTFGGTLTGVIPAGASSVDLTVTYSKGENGVALTATSGGLGSGTSATFTVGPAATKLIVSAPAPGTPTATQPFSVIVTAVDGSNAPARLPADTTVTIGKSAGAGTLGGALTGTIAAGNNFTTIYGITYSQADTGVVLTASGSGLATGSGAPFNVNALPSPGAPTRIDIRSGNSQTAAAGSPVALAPTVLVRDSHFFPLAGATVIFTATGGAGSVNGSTTTTDALGLAQVGSWTLGIIGGKNTLTATVGGISVNITATATGGTGLLQFSSGPLATPQPAGVGQTIQFSAATNLQSTFAWQFGDGSGDASGNSTTSHAYAAAGTYIAAVTASSPPQSITGNLTITVNAPLVGVGNDSDGDGFSDAYEVAAGTNPNDASSVPFSTANVTATPVVGATFGAKLNFKKAHSDSVSISGIIPIPAGLTVAGAQLGVTIGSFIKIFPLDVHARGKSGGDSAAVAIKSVKGKVPLQNSKFTIKLSREDLAAALAPFGLTNAEAKRTAVTVRATVVFAGQINLINATLHYTARKNVSGSTSK